METRADPRACSANLTHLLPYDYPDITLSGGAWSASPDSPVEKLRLPLRDLVGMNVELLCQLGQRLLALDGSQSHLRLEKLMRVSGGTVSSGLSCAARMPAAFRQKLHLSRGPDFQSQLSWAVGLF